MQTLPQPAFGAPESGSAAGPISARAMGALRPAAAYLDGLNAEQRRAVETTEGPILVLAGAGTGKTRVLTTRIAHLISTGRARPYDILAVTFTNKAAREMKHRIGTLVGPAGEGMPWLGTFHAIGTKILRRHAELVGLKSDFTILGTDDQLRLMKQVIADQNVDEKRWPARALSHAIDGWKNRGLAPEQVPPGEASAFAFGKGGALYTAYQARLATLNAVDFGDLLLLCLKLWRENPDVLANYQNRFRYILVDEYQDTNVAQYLWLRLLAQGHRNVACVGDDDQSIYGWRGAEVDNILRFEHDFPGATVVRLERNYRSTGHILAAASGLIAKNEGRLGKTLRTDDEAGERVTVSGAWDSEEEARLIAEAIERLQGKKHPLSEIAVLVRISAQMREIEDRFVQLGLPYRVIGGPRFYERAEIRDALAYLRVTANPADDLAFERIVNTPKRGLGDATLQQLHTYARAERVPLLLAARRLCETDELKPRVRSTLRALTESFSRWARSVESQPHSEVAQTILEESGYTEMWQKERSADAAGRLENLKEFVRSMEEFPDLAGFLEHVSLVMEASEAEGAERVSLMTLHAAKGLEFDTVFLPGWEDGLFPNQRALDESGRAGLEEERRLAHVGLTRARKRAKLSFAVNRRIHGLWSSTIPSRFIDELPEASVDVVEAPAHFSAGASRFDRNPTPFGSSYGTPGWQRAQAATQGRGASGPGRSTGGFGAGARSGGPRQIEGELIAKSTGSASAYSGGQRVFHTKFGPGTVAGVDGNKLTVDFDKAGRKMVLDSFVQPG
ncbi:ATP-dependent helicase [Methylobacterium dankookense]|uniref:DNA 3'-5' helicase n=1 Tax=Methylobacterium dankookense TaxID=560405 RepID=A0A564FT40_9HYPH|nr:UvrD-helicase domain-containing protein [Methylobacterium dankookense]GJD55360.1 DNA helicase II [Methylobacterium dankookense]VUF11212.1 DNA helicase II [Methylobacterium dankookense]